MSSSNTSEDNNIQYQNSQGENLLSQQDKKTTDTDFHFNMIVNPSKILPQKNTLSESSDFSINNMSSEKSSVKSKKKSSENNSDINKQYTESKYIYEKINIKSPINQSPINQPPINQPQQLNQPSINQPSINSQSLNNNIPTLYNNVTNVKQLTQQEVKMKKIEMLRKLSEIKLKGYQLSKEYDFNCDLEEMEYEYELLRSFADKRNGVKIFKRGLLQAVSVIEFLNDNYDPFDFQLSGWGEHVNIEIASWEDILEEIYEKYKGSGRKMAPEIKLLYFIIASASAFHFTKSYSSKLPGLDSVLASNPGLISKLMNPQQQKSQFMTPQELNIEKQKEELRQKEKLLKTNRPIYQHRDEEYRTPSRVIEPKSQILVEQLNESNIKKNLSNDMQQKVMYSAAMDTQIYNNNEPLPANMKSNVDIKQNIGNINIQTPDKVRDILSRIHHYPQTSININSETQDDTSSNNDRLVSETTMSDTNPKKRGRKPIHKKANISII